MPFLGPGRVEVVCAQSISHCGDRGLVACFEDLELRHAHARPGGLRGGEKSRRDHIVACTARHDRKAVESKRNEQVTAERSRYVECLAGVAFGSVEFTLCDLNERA